MLVRRLAALFVAVPIVIVWSEFRKVPSPAHAAVHPIVLEIPAVLPEIFPDSALSAEIDRLMQRCPGEPSIVIHSKAGWSIEHNPSEVVKAASLIKLPIMAALFSMDVDLSESILVSRRDRTRGSGSLRHGRLPKTFTALELIERMIIESDNTATNALLRHYGKDRIGAEFLRLGFVRTNISNMILASREDNPTTAAEIAGLLMRLDSLPGAETMREIMRRTVNDRRLGRYLSESAELAHKTGTLRSVLHDAGIIKTPAGDIVVVALVKSPRARSSAEKWLGDLGRTIYENSAAF